MKISKIAGLCKKSKTIYVYNHGTHDGIGQWIGDDYAMYPAIGLPYMEEDHIYTIFDIPEKDHDKFAFSMDETPGAVSFADAIKDEHELPDPAIEISMFGKLLRPLATKRGIVFIDTKYLEPLSDSQSYIKLFERQSATGSTYIAVKVGLMLMALIKPYDVINAEFVTNMEVLTFMCRTALEGNPV